jgi:hypothetical protein
MTRWEDGGGPVPWSTALKTLAAILATVAFISAVVIVVGRWVS